MQGGLVAVAVVLAPVAFTVVAFVSRTPEGSKRVVQAMALLLVLALPVGLLAPVLGVSAGYGAGVIVTLNRPRFTNVIRNRIVAVVFSVAYTFLLLVVITPAGVMTGALLPPLMVGFADEFTAWQASKAARK